MGQFKSLIITGAASFTGAATTFNGEVRIYSDIKLGSSSNLYLNGGNTYGLFNSGNAKFNKLILEFNR